MRYRSDLEKMKKVEAVIGKVKVEISASEDEKNRDFGELAAAIIVAICRTIK